MKTRTIFATIMMFGLASLASLASLITLPAAADTWEVDTAHSDISFSVRHFVSKVPGRFNDFSGAIAYDAENPEASTVEFTVKAASIDTRNENRDGHLRSPDFFDTEKFETLSFKSVKVTARDATHLSVLGDLTLHGVTKRILIPVEVLGTMGDKAGFQAEFTLDRKEYGVVWNRALDQGGTILGDEVAVTINVEANREKEEEEASE